MVAQPLEIHVDPESETGKLLAQAKGRTIHLVSDGARYRVEREAGDETDNDPLAGYDVERAAAAWRASFGVWAGMDIETLKAELKEQRGQDSRGRPGW